jgi:hypothetical protein
MYFEREKDILWIDSIKNPYKDNNYSPMKFLNSESKQTSTVDSPWLPKWQLIIKSRSNRTAKIILHIDITEHVKTPYITIASRLLTIKELIIFLKSCYNTTTLNSFNRCDILGNKNYSDDKRISMNLEILLTKRVYRDFIGSEFPNIKKGIFDLPFTSVFDWNWKISNSMDAHSSSWIKINRDVLMLPNTFPNNFHSSIAFLNIPLFSFLMYHNRPMKLDEYCYLSGMDKKYNKKTRSILYFIRLISV